MTTRELYFKIKYLADDMPVARMGYTFKDKDDVIQIFGGSICVELREMEETFKKIEKIEQSPGFMFWNVSPEGEKWYKDNWDEIGPALSGVIHNQK